MASWTEGTPEAAAETALSACESRTRNAREYLEQCERNVTEAEIEVRYAEAQEQRWREALARIRG